MEKRNPILDLIDLRRSRQFSPQEIAELEAWANAGPDVAEQERREVFVAKLIALGYDPSFALEDFVEQTDEAAWVESQVAPVMERSLLLYRQGKVRRSRRILYRCLAAASVIVVVTTAALFYGNLKKIFITTEHTMNLSQNPDQNTPANDAVLIYGNTVVQLDSLSNHPMNQPGTDIHFKDRELVYQSTDDAAPPVANKIITIPGKKYRVTLSDGTRVWLNGNSTLEYPNRFTGDIREVTLKGEGFFEVTASAQAPFVVRSGGHRVTVLGTRFNLLGYDSTEINTTLLEGSVIIQTGKTNKYLKPGLTASVNMERPEISISAADTAMITSWKEGRIAFDAQQIDAIMHRLSRIYDFGFTIKGDARRKYSAVFALSETADQIFKQLELNQDISFKWSREGRFVEVTLD